MPVVLPPKPETHDVKKADYSQFFKKKVTINVVEKQVKQYDLD